MTRHVRLVAPRLFRGNQACCGVPIEHFLCLQQPRRLKSATQQRQRAKPAHTVAGLLLANGVA